MSKVLITRSKLDDLATAVSNKSGVALPLTIAQMQTAVEGILNGNNLEYGLVDPTSSLIGVGTIDNMTIE